MAGERRYDIELAARNFSGSLGFTPRGLTSFDPGAWRGPRLLVPVTVEALVVTPQNAAGPWARTKIEPTVTAGGRTQLNVPRPFETFEGRPVGVHLHWALPDGLTKGEHDAPPEEEPPSAFDIGRRERREDETPQETKFPLVPDRWLVVRLSPGANPAARRKVAAWVIESEETDAARRVTPLEQWAESRGANRKGGRWLTAVGAGDPAYAAYYDNVQNALGFHDALEGVAAGPLTYVVMGWYSEPGDDPLHRPQTQAAWSALLDHLGWALGDTPEQSMERLTQAAEEAKKRAKKAGLKTNYEAKAAPQFILSEDAGLNIPSEAAPTRRAAAETLSAATDFVEAAPAGMEAAPAESKGVGFSPALMLLASVGATAFVGDTNLFGQYWPRQMICHGMVYDVAWNGVGGSYNTSDAGVPKRGSVGVAVGNTGVEALSAMVAARRGQANLEKIVAAFHYGLLPELDKADGLAALETLLHSEDFGSKPGGFVVDTIEEGDLFPQPARSERGPQRKEESAKKKTPSRFSGEARYEGVGQYGVSTQGVEAKFVVSDKPFAEVLADSVNFVTLARGEGATARPRKSVALRRSMPRYWFPNDPVVLLNQGKRSYKHGEDGRLSQDNKLVCRLTGETVRSLNPIVAQTVLGGNVVRATVTAADLAERTPDSGQLPAEARALYHEALLLDETNAPVAARALLEKDGYLASVAPQGTTERHALTDDTLTEKVRVEQTLLWNPVVDPNVDAQALTDISGLEGRMPSKVAVGPWRAPWTPLHIDWEAEWHPSPQLLAEWELRELDYARDARAPLALSAEPRLYSSRSLLTPGVAAVLAARVKKFLEDEPKGDEGQVNTSREAELGQVVNALGQLDVLAASMGNFHGLLVGREERHELTPEGGGGGALAPPPLDPAALFPVRAGHVRFQRLRIIDAFGQIYDFDRAALATLTCAEDVRVEADGSLVRLPPRIVQPSRLMFRLLSADSDAREATVRESPVCGWVVPDHLDEALEVYDAAGVSQGQVQLEPDGRALEWQAVPGTPGPLGGRPQLANQHLQRMTEGLLAWGVRDDSPAAGRGERARESALSSMLRMIDATLWTVDPLGREGDEHLSVLVGRPLAVVRAQLALETEDAPLTEELSRMPFLVRLGALTRLHDGLMGYFVNDDYSQFYPVHESIAEQARPSGPRVGFLGAISAVPRFYQSFGEGGSERPVTHPYINREPHVRLRPRQHVTLTLIVDPRGAVHATAGILPRKRIELMREHVAGALDAMTMTFRVGPVLADPKTVRMPLPAEIRGGWSWVRRTGATVWQESPVVNSGQDALLSPTPAEIAEGWLKLTGALKQRRGDEPS